jgi:hypothetical protein
MPLPVLALSGLKRKAQTKGSNVAKRFVDSEIFKSPSIRALEAPYKLLWLYLVNDCDHAGIWVVDFDVASIFLGKKYTAEDSLKALAEKVTVVDGGRRWYINGFVEFQYGKLNPDNRAHKSVLDILDRFGICVNKPLPRALQGPMDKDKDKVEDKEKRARKSKPASQQEVEDYCQSLSLPRSDGEYMFAHWEGNGHTNGGKPVKDWKATIRAWKAASHLPSQKNGNKTGSLRLSFAEEAERRKAEEKERSIANEWAKAGPQGHGRR